jgi:uncharacterized protein
LKAVLVVLGTISLSLGVVGLFVPILPTTPFLLLSAACYARGSRRMYDWLLSRPRVGRFIRDYREGRGVPLGAKMLSIGVLWATIGYAVLFVIDATWLRVLLLVIAVGVTSHLLLLPTGSQDSRSTVSGQETTDL